MHLQLENYFKILQTEFEDESSDSDDIQTSSAISVTLVVVSSLHIFCFFTAVTEADEDGPGTSCVAKFKVCCLNNRSIFLHDSVAFLFILFLYELEL